MLRTTFISTLLFACVYGYSSSCDRAGLIGLSNNIRTSIQQWQGATRAKDFYLHKATEVFQKSIDQYEKLVEECSDEEKLILLLPMLMGVSIIADDHLKAELFLNATSDEEYLGHVVGLFCALDCNYLLNFTKKFESPSSRIRIYNVMSRLLEETDLNHTEIDTKLSFIKHVDVLVVEETDENAKLASENLLLNAIKTDLVLQHDNIDKLYTINKDVTRKAIHDLIDKFINIPITNDDELLLYPLFEIIKCTSYPDIWIENLKITLDKLKKSDKLESVYTLMLLISLEGLENKVTGLSKMKLDLLKAEIPNIVNSAYKGHFCVTFGKEEKLPNKIFLLPKNDDYEVVKFEPRDNGSKALLAGKTDKFNCNVITDDYEKSEKFYDGFGISFTKVVGDFTVLENHEFCDKKENSLHACLPLKAVVPPTNFGLKYVAVYRKLAQYYLSLGACHSEYW